MKRQIDDFIFGMTYPTLDILRDDIENQILYPLSYLKESDSEWLLEFDLPMVDKKDISISLDNENTITVEAKLREVYCDTSLKQQYEFHYFKKSVTLPSKIDTRKISAKFDSGRLVIRVPKISKKKRIPIK